MSNPEVTHSFTLQHLDGTTGIKRELSILVMEQQNTQFCFITKAPNEEPFESTVSLSEIGLAMLCHALTILGNDMDEHRHPDTAPH